MSGFLRALSAPKDLQPFMPHPCLGFSCLCSKTALLQCNNNIGSDRSEKNSVRKSYEKYCFVCRVSSWEPHLS